MKELVYKTPLVDEDELVARIIVAAAANNSRRPHVMFKNVRESMHKICRACNAVEGHNFEKLLWTAMVAKCVNLLIE